MHTDTSLSLDELQRRVLAELAAVERALERRLGPGVSRRGVRDARDPTAIARAAQTRALAAVRTAFKRVPRPQRIRIIRRRRSPLEHVRALATALAAARGHETAVRLMAQGLRRRLSRAGRAGPADLDRWLAGLADSLRTDRGRRALATLTDASTGSPTSAGVLEAANAVEILWEELKPS